MYSEYCLTLLLGHPAKLDSDIHDFFVRNPEESATQPKLTLQIEIPSF
jgi:hypothetical protein